MGVWVGSGDETTCDAALAADCGGRAMPFGDMSKGKSIVDLIFINLSEIFG